MTDYEVVNAPRPHRNSVEHITSSPSSPSKLFTPEVASLDHAKNHKISLLFKAIEQGDTPLVYQWLTIFFFFRFLIPQFITFSVMQYRVLSIEWKGYLYRLLFSQGFHSVKMISDVTLCIARSILDLKETRLKFKQNVINKNLNAFVVEYGIYFMRETGFFHLFTRVFTHEI